MKKLNSHLSGCGVFVARGADADLAVVGFEAPVRVQGIRLDLRQTAYKVHRDGVSTFLQIWVVVEGEGTARGVDRKDNLLAQSIKMRGSC